MSESDRQLLLQLVTKKLVFLTMGILLLITILIYALVAMEDAKKAPILVVIVFTCGLLGGFVSMQQRLPKISIEEMSALSTSWLSITLIPINGGIFSLVLMFMFMAGMIQGVLFPVYPEVKVANTIEFYDWMKDYYPIDSKEIAKLIFWSFVAGFSERLVPQVIRKFTDQVRVDRNQKLP